MQTSPIINLARMPCTTLKGIGNKVAEHLHRFGVHTVQDLLFHLPLRYQDRTRITPIGSTQVGQHVVVQGNVEVAEINRQRRPMLLCQIWDGTGRLILRFFHFNFNQFHTLNRRGALIRCFGEIRGWGRDLEMIHPEYQFVSPDTPLSTDNALTPIYPTTEGLTQRTWRLLTDQALKLLNEKNGLPEYLPESLALVQENIQQFSLIEALHYVHRPPADAPVDQLLTGTHPAQQRLAFEELLAHHLSLRQLRYNMRHHRAPELIYKGNLIDAFLTTLPFHLTHAQQRVLQEISQDMAQSRPMMRLLQGDVGSGKTVIAALAALQAVENNYQAVLMAPTELLAEQHYHNFVKWLEPLGLRIAWLAGKLKGKAREAMLAQMIEGKAAVSVGTHALFQADVQFARLGLIMIDEQHRFGVHQRLALREKGIQEDQYPHQLIMTATPIPRTLAMTAYADLDTSIIDELPPGRTPVQTVVISDQRRHDVIARVRQAGVEQRQVYWVCPLIEESEVLQCQAAETAAQQLTVLMPELRVGLVHGRMPAKQKEEIMRTFKNHELDILVATTVIEVGVDVPNASLMVIENAERLGLAQLHQLRGRVGRGSVASFCVLMYQHLSQLAKARLSIMRETNDGFEIARKDLEIRGPGEVLGTRQTGMLQMRVADIIRDQALLTNVQLAAETLLNEYPQYMKALIDRWLGQSEKYKVV